MDSQDLLDVMGVMVSPENSCTAGGAGLKWLLGLNGTNGEQEPPGPPVLPGTLNCTEQQQLKEEILATVREEISMLKCRNKSFPECVCVATSCKELCQCNPALPSGYYLIKTSERVERVYCEMDTTNCGDVRGGWMKAAYINMTNENNTCPDNLTYTVVNSTRMCTRPQSGTTDCSSVIFPTHRVPYTKVCGRVIMLMVCQSHMAALETTSGHLQQGCQRTTTTPTGTVPVLPLILVQLHLHLWERSISVSQGTLDHGQPSGTLMTLCGTHSGVQVRALAAVVVVHGSLLYWDKK